MGVVMSGFKRGSALGAGLVLTSLLAACSGGQTGSGEPPAQETSQAQPEVAISNPKDASAVPLCNLLPDDTARSLGFETPGEQVDQSVIPEAGSSCEWRTSETDDTSVSLAVMNRRIADYYANPPKPFFSKLTVAGSPAAAANDAEPMQLGICDVYAGTQDDQMIVGQVTLSEAETGKKDPCQVAQQALEAAISTLPPAK